MNARYMTSSELKTRAKDLLEGRFGSAILILFVGNALTAILSMFPNSLLTFLQAGAGLSQAVSGVISLALSAAVSLFTNIFSAGYALFFLNVACRRGCDVGCLFYGFRWQFQKCLQLSGVFAAASFGFMLPFQICQGMFRQTESTGWLMATMLFACVALIGSTLFSLVFSQCYYLMLDFPDYTAEQLLRNSMRIMRGHKGRFFYLQVSFLPLVLLCLLTCGIGMLWLRPYVQMTYACFFLDLMNPQKTSVPGSATPPQTTEH